MKLVIAALVIVIGIAAGTGMTVACEMPQPDCQQNTME